MLRSDLCDYSDAYIVITGHITVEGANNRDRKMKYNAPSISCISKINGVLIENAAGFDIVMSMHNLIEYSKNYRKTTSSLWNYDRDEPKENITNSASSKYKSSLVEKTPIVIM